MAVFVLLASGCADGSGEPGSPAVSLDVTRDFGTKAISSEENAQLEGPRTQLRLLRDNHSVKTAWDGAGIGSIDGLRHRPDPTTGDETIWVSNVNGIETDVMPKDYKLYDGDVVQWDLRDWYITLDVRATVGAFPETFSKGVFGARFPVEVRCSEPSSPPCRKVKRMLRAAGVKADGSRPRGSRRPPKYNPQRATILVGPWNRWRTGRWTSAIDRGPRYSGVFARFAPDGRSLRLLDWNAHRVRTGGPGTGLIAAIRPGEENLVWLITGVDETGVARAADALDSDELRNAFAAVVTDSGVQKLPLQPNPKDGDTDR